ncbi:MAG: Maebl [Chitinophagaceae bacterium]|nr:Maebl [Chitinophagaceae bacterium]
MDKNFKIAVLIDGDNAQPKLLKEILEEVAQYGKATIRRIYGDWTITQMNGWKEPTNQYSFNPIQKFAYTIGKNSTDGALIIDAMDILHERNIDGFCIVSSDSDYTGLAKRIREQGVFVMGIGRKTTPIAFIQSCDVFTFTENIEPKPDATPEAKKLNHKNNKPSKNTPGKNASKEKIDLTIIDKAFDISTGEEEQAYISQVGLNLRKIDPSFDSRAFGYKTLTKLFQNLPNYEVIKSDVNGNIHLLVKRR